MIKTDIIVKCRVRVLPTVYFRIWLEFVRVKFRALLGKSTPPLVVTMKHKIWNKRGKVFIVYYWITFS